MKEWWTPEPCLTNPRKVLKWGHRYCGHGQIRHEGIDCRRCGEIRCEIHETCLREHIEKCKGVWRAGT